eukprot:2043458-Amphidinium_carterae.4
MPTVTQIGQVVQSAQGQQLESYVSCGVHQLCTTRGLRQLLLKVQLRQNSMQSPVQITHLQSVIIEMGMVKSAEGIKLHLRTDSASGKDIVSKLGLVESGVIAVHRVDSEQSIKHPYQVHATIHTQQAFQQSRIGIDEVSIHDLRMRLEGSAISSSSTAPTSRKNQ